MSKSRKVAKAATIIQSSFHQAFLDGDKLAPFQELLIWKLTGEPVSRIPDWVVEHFAEILVTYFREARTKPNANFRQIAGLASAKGTAWSAATLAHKGMLYRYAFDRCLRDAMNGTNKIYLGTNNRPISILNKSNSPTIKFQAELARRIGLTSQTASDETAYRAARKALRKYASPTR